MDKWDLIMQDKRLKEIFKDIDLTQDEYKYLKWLWKWDWETRDTFVSIFLKLKNSGK
jgi:hypothetical protein